MGTELLKFAFSYHPCVTGEHLSYEQVDTLEKRGILRKFNTIEWYAKQIGYSKKITNKSATVNDVLYILSYIQNSYPNVKYGNVDLDLVTEKGNTKKYDITEDGLRKDLLLFGIDVAFTYMCEWAVSKGHGYLTTGHLPRWSTSDVLGYYYLLNRTLTYLTGLRKDCCYYGLESLKKDTYNYLAVCIARDILRACGFNSNMNMDRVLTLDWYNLVLEINGVIKEVMNNYSLYNVNDFIMPTKTLNKFKKTQPKEYKEYRQKVEQKAREIREQIEKQREDNKRIQAIREARMNAYDKMCDKFGCALPMDAYRLL